jgi:glutathione S-transferase
LPSPDPLGATAECPATRTATLYLRVLPCSGNAERPTFLLGERFTVADAYCFTIVSWSRLMRIELAPYPNLKAYMERIAARPKVQEALRAEGLLMAAS